MEKSVISGRFGMDSERRAILGCAMARMLIFFDQPGRQTKEASPF